MVREWVLSEIISKKEGKRILKFILIAVFSFSTTFCYSENTSVLESETQEKIENTEKTSTDSNTTESGMIGVEKTFNRLVNWVSEKLEGFEKKYFKRTNDDPVVESFKNSDLAKEPEKTESKAEFEVVPRKPLNLTIPEVAIEGKMAMDNGISLTLPNLFAEQEKPFVKEKPSASFGGRILMDDAELEGMQEYRLKDVGDAVLGAEVSLEFKTN